MRLLINKGNKKRIHVLTKHARNSSYAYLFTEPKFFTPDTYHEEVREEHPLAGDVQPKMYEGHVDDVHTEGSPAQGREGTQGPKTGMCSRSLRSRKDT